MHRLRHPPEGTRGWWPRSDERPTCRYLCVRITVYSWLLVLAGGALFGLGLIGVARVLPTSGTGAAAIVVIDHGLGVVRTPVAGARGLPIGEPPLAPVEARPSGDGLRVLDLRVVDETLRDRNGNAPKRALMTDDLRLIAPAYDVIADDLAQQPDGVALSAEEIAVMHAINPRLRVVRVLETLTANDPTYAGIRPDDGTHSAWVPRDASGEPVLVYGGNAAWNRQPNFLLDPGFGDVRLAIAARARQYVRLGYDGVLLRGISARVPDASGAPIDPATKRPYGDGDWAANVGVMIAEVRRIAAGASIYVEAADHVTVRLVELEGAIAIAPVGEAR